MAEDNRRIAFLKDALNNLAAAVKEVSAGLIDLEGVIARITGKTRDFAKANNEATTSVNKTSKAVKESTASMKANESQTNKTTKANKGFFGNIGKNLKTIVSFYGAYQVLNLAISAFTELTVGSARRAIALEKSLADLKAVAGLTSDDIVRLKNVVFDVAGATSLTSTEVVELQKQLAKLGSSTEEIENLTRPIALLSQALGEDAGGVAATLKKTLNQFQATSEEADRFCKHLNRCCK
jgi:mRNA-degrading endonuclease HigB of HigAB toxin-antitoxin module